MSPDGRPGFGRFWVASTVSDVGTYVTTLALQVLVVVTLQGSATDVGVVGAARWLPYLVLGVVVGVLADRVRQRPVLVATDLGRAALLTAIPLHPATLGFAEKFCTRSLQSWSRPSPPTPCRGTGASA